MYRKVTKTGPATLTLALPAAWIKEQNIKQGQYIEVSKLHNDLLVSALHEDKEDVRIEYNTLLIENMLEKLFLESESSITIHSDKDIPKSVYNIIQKFPGMQIVEEKPREIVINRTLRPSLESPGPLLRRCYIIIHNSLRENPAQFPKELEENLFLLQIHQNRPKEVFLLREFYETIRSENKPIYDDAYSMIQNMFEQVYNQKYAFNPSDTKALAGIIANNDKLFAEYHKKSRFPLELFKIYHCCKILDELHKEILYDKSINDLNESMSRPAAKRFKIGVCLKNQSNAFWAIDVKQSMQDASSKYTDAGYLFDAPMTDFDIVAQERILQKFLDEGMNGIILAPVRPRSLAKTIEKINNAKIPLLIIDTDIELSKKYTFIGFDNYQGGYLTGQYIKNRLPKGSNVLILAGHSEGNFSKRVTGCVEGLGKGYKTIILQGEFQESIAYDNVTRELKRQKIDAIFATSDNMAQGAIKAAKTSGKNPLICGFDMTRKGLEAFEKKEVESIVNTKPKELGSLAVETMESLLHKRVVAEKIEYKIEFITRNTKH